MLSMELLGTLTIRVDDQRIRAEFGSAGRRLAAYLAQYSGRPHRRERLVDLFWSGLEPNRARSALNTALWRLREERSGQGGDRCDRRDMRSVGGVHHCGKPLRRSAHDNARRAHIGEIEKTFTYPTCRRHRRKRNRLNGQTSLK